MKTPAILKRAAAAVLAAGMIVGLAACGSGSGGSSSGKEAYKEYVTGIMDANYLGSYDKYMEVTGATEEEAQQIYELNIQDFTQEIGDALSIKMDVISAELTDRISAMAKTIYSQASYQAVDVIRDGDTYTVTMEIEPVLFFGTLQTDFQSAVNSFNDQAKNGELDDLSEQEYEEAYGEAVISELEGKVSGMTMGSKINVDVVLDYDKENNVYVISDERMEALDDKVVNMSR